MGSWTTGVPRAILYRALSVPCTIPEKQIPLEHNMERVLRLRHQENWLQPGLATSLEGAHVSFVLMCDTARGSDPIRYLLPTLPSSRPSYGVQNCSSYDTASLFLARALLLSPPSGNLCPSSHVAVPFLSSRSQLSFHLLGKAFRDLTTLHHIPGSVPSPVLIIWNLTSFVDLPPCMLSSSLIQNGIP